MLNGGDGGDNTVSYENSDRRVSVESLVITDTASGGHAQGDDISNFQNIIGSAYDDILVGDDMGNTLKGLAGNDELVGGDGADTLEGGAGADELDGDNGREDDGQIVA